jgi:hypothetical protein
VKCLRFHFLSAANSTAVVPIADNKINTMALPSHL